MSRSNLNLEDKDWKYELLLQVNNLEEFLVYRQIHILGIQDYKTIKNN